MSDERCAKTSQTLEKSDLNIEADRYIQRKLLDEQSISFLRYGSFLQFIE